MELKSQSLGKQEQKNNSRAVVRQAIRRIAVRRVFVLGAKRILKLSAL
jgi:hypothetical protein